MPTGQTSMNQTCFAVSSSVKGSASRSASFRNRGAPVSSAAVPAAGAAWWRPAPSSPASGARLRFGSRAERRVSRDWTAPANPWSSSSAHTVLLSHRVDWCPLSALGIGDCPREECNSRHPVREITSQQAFPVFSQTDGNFCSRTLSKEKKKRSEEVRCERTASEI